MSYLPEFGSQESHVPLVAHDVREYFKHSVSTAMEHQNVFAADDTIHYVVNVLTQFTRSDALFECTPDGYAIRPLALFYAEAAEAGSRSARDMALKRLGDVALLIAGMFSASLDRKLVNIDYYIAMGGGAYGFLSNSSVSSRHSSGRMFAELAAKFQAFVDVLAEVSDNSGLRAPTDVMRLYENWARTGSQRAADKLRKLGIEPSAGSVSLRHS
jgi:hypothetical protein